ncbi:MAG: 4-hydroxythreonine-4-phosphate dehydrogenase PdxA [Magnetococcales bacterium]|nr:4-hydroxythreonine-4-phosphate dehydrogenase PdxA [Magnetococcales bacterium]MBF0322666.1 4-hydroxythreonine-4-phosphate dehydrogenase PdxA [Magnetococcales bacterium]
MLAVTMGDPAGVGPEIVLKAFAAQAQQRQRGPRWLFVGDHRVLAWSAQRLGLPCIGQPVGSPEEASVLPRHLPGWLATAATVPLEHLRFGVPDTRHAAAVVESIETACRLAVAGRVAGVVTPPIHKGVLHAAGYHIPGHTELLAHCTGAEQAVMMLVGKGLRVVLATIHQSLASVTTTLNSSLLTRIIDTTLTALQRDFGLSHPRLAVTGLNPHAGEGGAFGQEEQAVIAPVCASLAARYPPGTLRGPLPADTLFHPQARRTYDAVLCMYHDQALIPLKMLAFGQAVNVTLGLPIIRTSVDHGTAFDIAGQGIADPGSLVVALRLAARLVRQRRLYCKRSGGSFHHAS